MVKHIRLALVLLLGTAALFTACRKDPKPGKGGNAVLKITPKHHGKPIDSCTIYIKYGATDHPSSFDDSAKCILVDSIPVATFSNLNKGQYYLFGAGWDPGIDEEVEGGVPYNIKEETVQSYSLSVTEANH